MARFFRVVGGFNFFFSSRRRHTRCSRDWSSDVCSSDLHAWTVPPLFRLLQQRGDVSREEMFRTFNMGVGLVVACAARHTERVINTVARAGEPNAVRLGFVVAGDRTV